MEDTKMTDEDMVMHSLGYEAKVTTAKAREQMAWAIYLKHQTSPATAFEMVDEFEVEAKRQRGEL